jgi:2-aminoadipate transaminase
VKRTNWPEWSKTALAARESVLASLMTQALTRPGILSLAAGFTDNTVVPTQIVREAVAHLPADGSALQYGSNPGRPKLREILAQRLARQDGVAAPTLCADRYILTSGSQQALYLAAQALCDEGDIVLVEAPTYFVVFDVFYGLGLRVLEMPMTAAGQVDPEGVATLLKKLETQGELPRVKLAYFITYYSNPTALSMDLSVKRALGKVFAERAPRVVTLEDTAYRDLYFTAPHPAPSLAALPEWEGLSYAVMGSFSKCFSPGLRLGWIAANLPEMTGAMLRIKAQQDFGSGNLSQWIAEYAFTSGVFEGFVGVLRHHYADKAFLMSHVLGEFGLKKLGWSWARPEGGLLFWLSAPEGLDTGLESDFCRAALAENVLYVPGAIAYADPQKAPKNRVRIAFGAPRDVDLIEAARRFAKAAARFA